MKIHHTEPCDVAVIGGGSAGLAAAICAARHGLSTVLIEQQGFCGGISVTAMVHSLDGLLAQHDFSRLAVGGFAAEFVERLHAGDGIACLDNPPESVCFDPEVFKRVADECLIGAGVRSLFHTRLVDVEVSEDRIRCAIVHSKAGHWRIAAKYYVDASGDGDLCAWAGAAFEVSEELQPMTQHFRISGLRGGRTWKELEVLCHAVLWDAYEAGSGPRFGGPWIVRVREREISLNCTRLYGNPLDPRDLTAAEMEGRANAWKVWRLWRQALPEFRESVFDVSGPCVGIRESRRVIGDYQLTGEDILKQRAFPDTIGLGAWPLDIHPGSGAVGYHPHKENPPPPYAFPLRAMCAKSLENVFCVGRCASTTHQAHGSTRVQATAMMMGEASAAACAAAVRCRKSVRDVPFQKIQELLIQNGAILDPFALPLRPAHWRLPHAA